MMLSFYHLHQHNGVLGAIYLHLFNLALVFHTSSATSIPLQPANNNQLPKGIMRSAVPLPCFFDVVKSQRVAGQWPWQGTKSGRMGEKFFMSVHTSIRLPILCLVGLTALYPRGLPAGGVWGPTRGVWGPARGVWGPERGVEGSDGGVWGPFRWVWGLPERPEGMPEGPERKKEKRKKETVKER